MRASTHHTFTHASTSYTQICEQIFGDQLYGIVDLRAVHDFAAFLKNYRPKSADRHIRKQFAFTFENREGRIFVRAKGRCSAETPWGQWAQILPHPDVDASVVHDPETCPPMATPKPWPELQDTIVPQLTKFYEREYVHPVTIPDRDLEAMRK